MWCELFIFIHFDNQKNVFILTARRTCFFSYENCDNKRNLKFFHFFQIWPKLIGWCCPDTIRYLASQGKKLLRFVNLKSCSVLLAFKSYLVLLTLKSWSVLLTFKSYCILLALWLLIHSDGLGGIFALKEKKTLVIH
jgi:hypothetical protein